ncbi:uncharacterized protein LOC129596114 isoform X2 [Paramacrobiotus metropolitanus]|uniref:uncharacterized protein LOC129596114 isoform X2 n=1 Tax=Paramacrobiotus metropolitanus TaxID=2943436 RepID=UPI002445FCF1|nr:uncharacterized protein LOC129596114 isoform X2 [Paramacrobiotus metropolitanus]
MDASRADIVLFLDHSVRPVCYRCRSGTDCDRVSKDMEVECTAVHGDIHTCIKADVDAKVIRDCGVPNSLAHACLQESGVSVCMCSTNLCNGTADLSFRRWTLNFRWITVLMLICARPH